MPSDQHPGTTREIPSDSCNRADWRPSPAHLDGNGATLAFGSDWPVADISPLRGIKPAVCRKRWDNGLQDERVGLMATLAAYALGGARAAHCGHDRGIVKLGYLADLVVLTGDIEAVAVDAVDRLDVALAICGGRIVYRRPPPSL